MATFKAEVYAHQKKQDGTYNIKIRVTQGRKKRYLATPWFVTKDDITRSMKIKNQKYIDLTNELISQYRDACDRKGMAVMDMDIDQIVELIQNSKEEKFDLDIIAYIRNYIEELNSKGRSGTAKSYSVLANNLIRYVGRDKISIFEITIRFLKDWSNWMKNNTLNGKGGDNSIHTYPSRLRAIYRRAKKEFNDEDAGIIRIPNSPFSHFDIPKEPVVKKRALTIEQIKAIAALPYSKIKSERYSYSTFNLAKDAFLISFGLLGMNPVDLYNCTDYSNGRITYQRTKTKTRRSDKAEISVKVEPEIAKLIEKYRDPLGKRVFNFYLHYSSVTYFDHSLNKGLDMIEKLIGAENLQFYAARHSWATIAVNDAGIDKYTVHQALNHVDESMKITDVYIRKSYDGNDKANRAVLDLVFGK